MAQHLDASHEDQSRITPLFHPYCHSALADCVADTSLYTFWKFKLDATIFNYMDAPKQAMASVSTGYVVMRLLWITVFSVLLSWTCIRLTPKTFPVLPINLKMLLHNFTYVLLGGLIFLAIRGGGRTFHHEYRQRLFQ